ncbi:MAG: DUF177 domain-containing protein [Lactobacillaceae bacterium]|jgi:uncharacterized protein|nr:DUF177 domain-containing protein [Lactobacillaceae bacterium]
MKFTILELQKYKNVPLEINEVVDLSDRVKQNFSDRISKISPMKINGQIQYKNNDRIKLNLNVYGSAFVQSRITLKDVEYKIDLNIDELYVQDEVSLNMFPLTEQVFLLEDNWLDIDDIVLQNIIVFLPLSADEDLNEENIKGEGWQIFSEDEYDLKINEEKEPTQRMGDFFPEE